MTILNPMPYTFTNGSTADATQVNANLSQIVSDANSNAAHSGANSDITSLSALSTPLSTGQGGTGSAATPTGLQNLSIQTVLGPTFLSGFTLSNNAGTPNTKLDVAAGAACALTGGTSLLYQTANTIDLSGTGPNGLDSGSLGASTWYYVYVIGNASGSSQAYIASANGTAPTYPATYTQARRIGAFRTDGSSHVLAFKQQNNRYLWAAPVADVAGANPADTSAHLQTLTVPVGGFQVEAMFLGHWTYGAASHIIFTSPDTNDVGPGSTNSSLSVINANDQAAGAFQIRTNTSGQIRYRASSALSAFSIYTLGWVDYRGQQ